MSLKLPISIALSLIFTFAPTASAIAQQKRQTPAKPPAAPAAKPTPVPTPPPPTFDTLLSANTYRVYAEIRSVGQLIRSNSVNEILEPIMKLAAPPKEFKTVIKWLNAHADEVMTSRMFVATWAAAGTEVPEAVVAIEFASAEEAAKFQLKLNDFLQKMLPPTPSPTPESSPKVVGLTAVPKDEQYSVKLTVTPPKAAEAEESLPPYHIQQAGSLILITPRPLKLNKLRPAGSKLLSEDANFRTVRNRFSSESIFVFVNSSEIQKEEEEQQKKFEEQHKQAIAEANSPENQEAIEKAKQELEKEMAKVEPAEPAEIDENEEMPAELKAMPPDQQKVYEAPSPPPIYMALGMILSAGSITESKWPDAIGVAISLETESFDVRALMVNKPGEKSDPIPFFPLLAPGPPVISEAPNILPADTEMLVSFSLDLPQIYSVLATPRQLEVVPTSGPTPEKSEFQPTMIAEVEKRLKINIKDELLPLLGSEVVVGLPLTNFGWIQPPPSDSPSASPSPSPNSSPSASPSPNAVEPAKDEAKTERAPVVVLSVKDKEALRTLLPKLVESVAFKGANSFAQTERREDTEMVSYMNLLAYAFIGNYLVISPDAATTRHVVDSYLKHQTLAGDPHFKNYTRWQPRQSLGQIYLSPVLMESYRKWAQQPSSQIDDQTRAFLTKFSIVAQPVTYSLSNEGFGPMHELHLPKNLVLLLIAAAAGGMNAPAPDAATPPTPPKPDSTNPFF